MPIAKITDQHLAKLQRIAKAMGKGATPAHAFASALDDAHAKHFGPSEDGEPEEPAPDDDDEGGADAATKSEPAERWEEDGEWPKERWGSPQVDPAKAVAALNSNVEKATDDVPAEKRGGKPNPLSTLKRWAQGTGARNATEPRPQRRG